MITGPIKSQIDQIWNAFWSGGISNPLEVIEQITYLLFLRRLDDLHKLEENKAAKLKRPMERRVFPKGKDKIGKGGGRPYEDLRWSKFKNFAPADMFEVVGHHAFPFLREGLAKSNGGEDSTYAHHMKDARFTIPTPALLDKVVQLLDAVPMDDRDTKGDVYEYMLGKIASAGSLDYETTAKDLQQIVKTKKTELLFLALFLRLMKPGGRAAVIVPDGVLFGSSTAHKTLRKILVEDQKLDAVVKLPGGVFKPYAGVSTAILLFTKTNSGGTDHVWFYDVQGRAGASTTSTRRYSPKTNSADALRAKRRAAITQLDTLTQSIFLDMFGDPATNPKGWSLRKLGDLFASSPIYGTMIPPKEEVGDWVSLRVANIQDWQLDLSDQKFVNLPESVIPRHSVRDGDMLLARAIASEEHLGKSVVVYPGDKKWAFDSHLMRLRFDQSKAVSEVVRSLLMTPGGRRVFLEAARRSAVQFNINTKEIAALAVPLPPIELQKRFISLLESIENVRSMHSASLARMDSLFASAQQYGFQGVL